MLLHKMKNRNTCHVNDIWSSLFICEINKTFWVLWWSQLAEVKDIYFGDLTGETAAVFPGTKCWQPSVTLLAFKKIALVLG